MIRSRQQRRAQAALTARDQGRRTATSHRATSSRRPSLFIGAAALVVAAAAIAAVLLGGAVTREPGEQPTRAAEVANPTLSRGGLPAYTGASEDPAVGQTIPEVTGTSFDGTPVSIALDGRPKILLFLAHWCPHCQAEVPVVQRWLDAGLLPAGVDLISVATSIDPNRPNYPPDAWLAREGWTAPVLVDPEGIVATGYGLGAFPYWVLVKADGNVSQRLTGELSEAQLDALAGSLRP